jgi:hypothetical protein
LFDDITSSPINAPSSFTVNLASFLLYETETDCNNLVSSCSSVITSSFTFLAGQQTYIQSASVCFPCSNYPYSRRGSITINGTELFNTDTLIINSCFTIKADIPINCQPTLCPIDPRPTGCAPTGLIVINNSTIVPITFTTSGTASLFECNSDPASLLPGQFKAYGGSFTAGSVTITPSGPGTNYTVTQNNATVGAGSISGSVTISSNSAWAGSMIRIIITD